MKRKINFIFLILVFLSNISASPWSGLSDKIMDMRLPTNAEQFINVETKFSFSVPEEGEVKKTMIYGSPSGDGGDYFIPNFKVGSEVSLFIDMNTSLLKNIAKNVRSDEKSPTREILVEVCIEKSKDITVTQTGGVQPYSNKEDVNGNSFYFFIIKNKSLYLHSVVLNDNFLLPISRRACEKEKACLYFQKANAMGRYGRRCINSYTKVYKETA